MISMDRSEVFSIAGSYFYSFLTMFSCLNLKKEEIAVRHLLTWYILGSRTPSLPLAALQSRWLSLSK